MGHVHDTEHSKSESNTATSSGTARAVFYKNVSYTSISLTARYFNRFAPHVYRYV